MFARRGQHGFHNPYLFSAVGDGGGWGGGMLRIFVVRKIKYLNDVLDVQSE